MWSRRLFQFARTWGARFLAFVGAVTLIVITTPALFWVLPWPEAPRATPTGDTLIVLGAGAVDGLPSLDTYWRCIYAMRYYHGGSIRHVVLSGGSDHLNVRPIAAVMADFLRAAGIPEDRLVLETSSTSTRENALNVAQVLKTVPANGLILLTSDYHLPRAAATFQRAGLSVQPVPAPYANRVSRMRGLRPAVLEIIVREYAKYAYYKWRGWA